VNDVKRAEGKLTGDAARTCYFKTGSYNQDNHRADGYPATAVNEVHIAAVKVQHDVPWAPGGYDPIGPGVRATRGGEPQPEQPEGPQVGAQPTPANPDDFGEAVFRSTVMDS
jgi:hypothetical protein